MCKHLTFFPIAEKTSSSRALAAVISTGLRYAAVDGRNLDGTGVGYINGEKFVVFKTGSNAIWQTTQDEFIAHLLSIDLMRQPLIGHVRAASAKFQKTKIDDTRRFPDKDAHPFTVDSILLAHNGTISNHEELVGDLDLDEGNIDSHMITELLAKESELELDNLNAVTSKFQGSFALIFQHLSRPNQVFIGRHGKPLYLVKVFSRAKDDGSEGPLELVFVTTNDDNVKDALSVVAHSCRYLLDDQLWGNVDVTHIAENEWYVLDRDTMRETGKLIHLGKLEWKKGYKTVTTHGSVVHQTVNGRGHAGIAGSNPWGRPNGTVKAQGIQMAQLIHELLKELPLTVEEFRYLYISLNQGEPDASMTLEAVESTVRYVLYLIKDETHRQHLSQFMDMDFNINEEGKLLIARHPSVLQPSDTVTFDL